MAKAKNPSYKKSTTTTLKAVGFLDSKSSSIEIDGNFIALSTLLSDFDGELVEFQMKVKEDEELDLTS